MPPSSPLSGNCTCCRWPAASRAARQILGLGYLQCRASCSSWCRTPYHLPTCWLSQCSSPPRLCPCARPTGCTPWLPVAAPPLASLATPLLTAAQLTTALPLPLPCCCTPSTTASLGPCSNGALRHCCKDGFSPCSHAVASYNGAPGTFLSFAASYPMLAPQPLALLAVLLAAQRAILMLLGLADHWPARLLPWPLPCCTRQILNAADASPLRASHGRAASLLLAPFAALALASCRRRRSTLLLRRHPANQAWTALRLAALLPRSAVHAVAQHPLLPPVALPAPQHLFPFGRSCVAPSWRAATCTAIPAAASSLDAEDIRPHKRTYLMAGSSSRPCARGFRAAQGDGCSCSLREVSRQLPAGKLRERRSLPGGRCGETAWSRGRAPPAPLLRLEPSRRPLPAWVPLRTFRVASWAAGPSARFACE